MANGQTYVQKKGDRAKMLTAYFYVTSWQSNQWTKHSVQGLNFEVINCSSNSITKWWFNYPVHRFVKLWNLQHYVAVSQNYRVHCIKPFSWRRRLMASAVSRTITSNETPNKTPSVTTAVSLSVIEAVQRKQTTKWVNCHWLTQLCANIWATITQQWTLTIYLF